MAGKRMGSGWEKRKNSLWGKQEIVQGTGKEGAQGEGKRRQGSWLLSPYSATYILPPPKRAVVLVSLNEWHG